MKNTYIQFKVNHQDKKEFFAYCKTLKHDKCASEVLLDFIKDGARAYRWHVKTKQSAEERAG